MALSNGSYDGGLVIYGRSTTTNQFFTIPLPFTSGSANEATVELNQGSWTFAAVAWDGDPDSFEGTALCALQSVNLNSTEQTVNLSLSATTCDDVAFGSNTLSSNFLPFSIVTCGTLYIDQTPTLLSSDSPGFCSSSSLDPDLRVHAKAFKLSVPVQVPGTAFGPYSPLTRCLDLTDGATSTNIRIPAKGMPLQIELLESSCADTSEKKLVTYPLQFGLSHAYTIFDRIYFTTSTFSRLYLPASLSRRGTSPFIASLPSFKCDGTNPCMRVPSNSSDRFLGWSNEIFVKAKATGESCSNLLLTNNLKMNSTDVSGSISTGDCREDDGKFYLRMNETIYSACTTSCTIYFDFKNDDNLFSLSVTKQGMDPADHAYDFIFRTLGFEDFTTSPAATTQNAMNSLSVFHSGYGDDENKNFGELSIAREMFRPDTLGGFLSTISTSQMSNYSMTFQVWDDGTQVPHHLSIVSDTSLVPAFMADDNDLTIVSNSTRTYTHRLTLSEIKGGAYVPKMSIRFINGEQVGQLESYHEDIDSSSDRKRLERSLIYWNTQLVAYGRFEKYSYEKEVQNTAPSNILRIRTSFTRAEREATSAQGNARLVKYEFNSDKDGANYDERATKTMAILKDNRAMYMTSSVDLLSTTLLNLFSENVFRNFVKSHAITSKSAVALSSNGTKMVSAWSEFDSGDNSWHLKVVVKSSSVAAPEFFHFDTGAAQGFIPRVTINNGGQATVSWIQQNTGPSFILYSMVKEGSTWRDTGNATVSTNSSPTNFAWNGGTSNFAFDLIDLNPASTATSDKILFFTDTGNLVKKTYSSSTPSWGSTSGNLGSIGGGIVDLRAGIVGTTYYVSFIKATGSAPPYGVGTVRTNLSAGTISNVVTFSASAPQLHTYAYSTNIQLVITDGPGSIQTNLLDTTLANSPYSSSGLGALTTYTGTTHRFNEPNTYCFARDMASSLSLGANNQNPPSGCVLPETSYAFPIRSEFRFNIDSLHPTNIISIFTLN